MLAAGVVGVEAGVGVLAGVALPEPELGAWRTGACTTVGAAAVTLIAGGGFAAAAAVEASTCETTVAFVGTAALLTDCFSPLGTASGGSAIFSLGCLVVQIKHTFRAGIHNVHDSVATSPTTNAFFSQLRDRTRSDKYSK